FLFPGIGYGGSCFPKDVQALAYTAEQNNFDFKILKSVMDVNTRQKEIFVEKILLYFKGDVKGKKLGVWGISFKPDTDDIREAPSIQIMKKLSAMGAEIIAYDPEGTENAKKDSELKVQFAENAYDALNEVDALLICTEWSEFRNPDFKEMKAKMKDAVIFDGRNIFSPEHMKKQSFDYISIGRENIFNK